MKSWPERLRALCVQVGLPVTPPTDYTVHAVRRYAERYLGLAEGQVNPKPLVAARLEEAEATLRALMPRSEMTMVMAREKSAVWECDGVKLVVDHDGRVRTVLPRNATKREYRPRKPRRRRP